MRVHLRDFKIIHEIITSYNSNQNEIIERINRMIMKRMKIIIIKIKFNKRLWMKIVNIIIYLKNHNSINIITIISYKFWHDIKSNLSYLKIIDSIIYIFQRKNIRNSIFIHIREFWLIMMRWINIRYEIW